MQVRQPELEVFISDDYNGNGGAADASAATWTPLGTYALPTTCDYATVPSGNINISGYLGASVYVAFKYTSTGTASGEGQSGRFTV